MYTLGIVLSFNDSTTPYAFVPLVAGVPAFLAAMAILVRSRRWVMLASLLFLLVAVGGPCVSWMIWGWPPVGSLPPPPAVAQRVRRTLSSSCCVWWEALSPPDSLGGSAGYSRINIRFNSFPYFSAAC